ncbi:hypothetical protein ANO11243_096200 [Dothideomycetidae sp. 11243]|nr:hypothetical protein ANO11243_096200 [fungal sp. No.11243]
MSRITASALTACKSSGPSTLQLQYASRTLSDADVVAKKGPHSRPSIPPSLSLSSYSAPTSLSVILKRTICIDIDAPFVSAPLLSPIVHLIQPSLRTSTNNSILESSDKPILSWLPPNPPPFAAPHRYLFMLFRQPEGFDVAAWTEKFSTMSRLGRMRWDPDGFVKEAGLGEVLAASSFAAAA